MTAKQQQALIDKIYHAIMSSDEMGLGEMGEAKETASNIVDEWMQEHGITVIKIKTQHIYPPIPVRDHDWMAYDENNFDEEGGSEIGYGATEQEAINNLLELLND